MTVLPTPGPATTTTRHHQSHEEHLTKREFEIAKLVAEALTDNQIAFRLHLSVFTVRCHVDNILYKLSLVNRVAICRWWYLNHYYATTPTIQPPTTKAS